MALLFLLAKKEKKENCKSADLQCLNGEFMIICLDLFLIISLLTNKHGLFFVIIARQDSKLSVTALCYSSFNCKI